MANTVISSNMNLPVPVVGVDPGPQYASDLNSCLALIDSHNHAAGNGVQITPSGLNINADFSIGSNNLILIRSSRYAVQGSPLALAADMGCVYVSGADLYYNDTVGNKIQITKSGGIAGTSGSIANLVSPASASYVAATPAFVFQSAANTPANLDGGSLVLRNIVANSKGLTLAPPNSMGSNYTITLPSLPASTKLLSIDNSGNVGTTYDINLLMPSATSFVPTGTIESYGSTSIPSGWLLCDGSAVSRTTYAVLFSVIGTNYGIGDGSTTFNLPGSSGPNLTAKTVILTYDGFGTVTSAVTYGRIAGDAFFCRGTGLVGTVNSNAIALILPTGYVIDISKLAGSNTDYLGTMCRGHAAAAFPSAAFGPFPIYCNGTETDRVHVAAGGSTSGFSGSTGSSLFSNGDRFMFDFNVPLIIVGSQIIKT